MGWLEQRAIEERAWPRCRSCTASTAGTNCPRKPSTTWTATAARARCASATPPAEQLQLDIYGELMDSIYLYDKYGTPIAYDVWSHLRKMLDWVADNWMSADDGIWEVRGGQQQFVYSKVQCWVALDRAIRLAHEAQSAAGSCPLGSRSATASTKRS